MKYQGVLQDGQAASIVDELQQRFGATKVIGSAGMPQLERTAEALKGLDGVHMLKYLRAAAQPGMPIQRPYHQLNNVSRSPQSPCWMKTDNSGCSVADA